MSKKMLQPLSLFVVWGIDWDGTCRASAQQTKTDGLALFHATKTSGHYATVQIRRYEVRPSRRAFLDVTTRGLLEYLEDRPFTILREYEA